jgi:hypothetical protein
LRPEIATKIMILVKRKEGRWDNPYLLKLLTA